MKSPVIILIMLAFFAAGPARAADGAGTEPSTKERIKSHAREAGHAIKKGARETGHAIKKGGKEAWSKTKTTVHNATHRSGKEEASH